jgi:hypothetical protein
MKNLMLIFVVALVFCPVATASDIAFYIGPCNIYGWYDESQFDDVETIIAETGYLFNDVLQFDDYQLDEFGAWIDERTKDGVMDIIWLNGTMPSVLYPFPNLLPEGSRAEEWLDHGNMFINVGDWFAYMSFEGGFRSVDNGPAGAENILNLPDIIAAAAGTLMTVTPTGKQFLPSLNDPAKTDRPVVLRAVHAPWEVAAVFASRGGTEDIHAEILADPVVLHNRETGGYIAIINQASDGPSGWIDDRGLTCAEFIANWVNGIIGLGARTLPYPADGAQIGDKTPVLCWNPRGTGIEYDVYFGTDFSRVESGYRQGRYNNFRGRWAEASYATEELEIGQTYYWRIEYVDAGGSTIYKSNVWSFTVVDALTIERQVASGQDDGYASNENLQNTDGDFLKIGSSSFTQPPYYASGMIFRNIDIPQGAKIMSAYLKIRSYKDQLSNVVYGTIQAEAADDAAEFGGQRSIGLLTKTGTSVDWDIYEPWLPHTSYTSPDIAVVIQEVIDRAGWSPNNSLTILYSTRDNEGGYRNFSSFEYSSDYAPKLEITYVPQ